MPEKTKYRRNLPRGRGQSGMSGWKAGERQYR